MKAPKGIWTTVTLISFLFLLINIEIDVVSCKKHSSSRSAPSRSGSGSRKKSRKSSPPPRSVPRYMDEDDYDEEEDDDEMEEIGVIFDAEEDEYDEEEEEEEEEEEIEVEIRRPKSRRVPLPPSSRRSRPEKRRPSKHRPEKRYQDDYYDEEEDDDYYRPSRRASPSSRRGPPPSRRGGPSRRSSKVVPYTAQTTSTFTRGLNALKETIPSASTVKESAGSALTFAKSKTTQLTSDIYREVKGLTSSELEQVMLKATRPDDSPVKGKHVERLVGVTYQISGRYDIYDAVLRKLWNKMAESDWRTTVKACYILHRFSADGAPDHQAALKARLRELRRTRDPKRKDKYFNSKQLLAGVANEPPEILPYRAFLGRYAHFVLLRAQCFSGLFTEFSQDTVSPPKKKGEKKPPKKTITMTSLRAEHLDASKLLLKAGCACLLKPGEECENTAIAVERVATDLIGLTTAVASALTRALSQEKEMDASLVRKWCEFYSGELRPQSKGFVKKVSPVLDKYGLFLPSRMGATVSQELLDKGLELEKEEEVKEEEEEEEKVVKQPKEEEEEEEEEEGEAEEEPKENIEEDDEEDEEEEEEEDEYEYDEEYDEE